MTPQEQQLLQDLTAKINQTVLPDKDPEAEQFLAQSLGRNPDALYILAQTVLVQNYALDQAKQQLDQARQQPVPQKHTSFLGNLLGMSDPTPPPPAQAQYTPVNYAPPQPQYAPPQYAQPQYAQPQYAQPQYAQPQFAAAPYGVPQQGGFLQSALRTATGVAAGALAFEGIESLMHGFDHHAGYGSGLGGSGLGGFDGGMGQPREEVINNYYGDQGRPDNHDTGFHDRLSNDLEDRRDDKQAFADSNSADNIDDDSIDDSSADDTQAADVSSDDNFDPSGNDSSF